MMVEENEEHPLVEMRDPEVAHHVLSGMGKKREVTTCFCCWNRKKVLCPDLGRERVGFCPSFVLDEGDIKKTEKRVMEFLQGTS